MEPSSLGRVPPAKISLYFSGTCCGRPDTVGRTYQLADPDPLTVDALIDAIAAETDRKVLRIPLPKAAAKAALDHVPGMYRLMQIPSASVDYFVHPTHYTTDHTRADLEGSEIAFAGVSGGAATEFQIVRCHR